MGCKAGARGKSLEERGTCFTLYILHSVAVHFMEERERLSWPILLQCTLHKVAEMCISQDFNLLISFFSFHGWVGEWHCKTGQGQKFPGSI